METELIVETLRALARSQQLQNEAEDGCRLSIKNCAEEGDLECWSPDEIELRFRRCALVFEHEQLKYPYVETKFDLYARDPDGDSSHIGNYRLITLLDGTVIDDYFVLDKRRDVVVGE